METIIIDIVYLFFKKKVDKKAVLVSMKMKRIPKK